MIEDQVLPSVLVRKGFAQLLRYPGAGRMLGDADMQDAPAIMANHEESIQQPEGNGGHGEEIHRSNGLPVILEKCLPASDGIRIAWRSLDRARDCPLRNIESELEQFAMNTRSAPGWILRGHLKDQISKFLVDSLPAWRWTSLRQELPIQTKSGAVVWSKNCAPQRRRSPVGEGPTRAAVGKGSVAEERSRWVTVWVEAS